MGYGAQNAHVCFTAIALAAADKNCRGIMMINVPPFASISLQFFQLCNNNFFNGRTLAAILPNRLSPSFCTVQCRPSNLSKDREGYLGLTNVTKK